MTWVKKRIDSAEFVRVSKAFKLLPGKISVCKPSAKRCTVRLSKLKMEIKHGH